jgi:hypothetical protein
MMVPFQRLEKMIPADQALANKALQASFEQIKNVVSLQLDELAATVTAIETNAGLGLIVGLQQAVPDSVRTAISSTVATGTGANGTLVLGDVLGCASGYNITAQMTDTVAVINTMTTTNLQNIYEVMANTANEDYGVYDLTITIPIGEPGYGTYANIDVAFSNLVTLAASNISTLVSTYPTQTTQLNSNFRTIANTVASQQASINGNTASGIDYGNLQANLQSVIPSFVDSLHDYGLQIATGEANDYLTAVANVSNQTGQAIVGCLREGRNLELLNNSGVGVNSDIPAT